MGYLPFEKRNEEIAKSQAIIVPSVREGWGLIVIEANALGTPAIGYDVPGLRDSIKNGKNGWLIEEGKTKAQSIYRLSEKLKSILVMKDKDRKKIEKSCLEYSKQFDWEKSTKQFEEGIE